jgi:Tol biopolymer transport system component
MIGAGLALLLTSAAPVWAPATFTLLDVSSAGVQANFDSRRPRLAADGRFVVFESDADNLVPGLLNTGHVFVRDRLAALTTIESLSSTGKKGNASSHRPDISADGRHVVFESLSTNLVPPDLNGVSDVFLRDRQLGTTELISASLTGAPANGPSLRATISDDGRYVAFQSFATDLVAGDGNDDYDIFVRDRLLGTTSLVSITPEGLFGDQGGFEARISGNGRHIAFLSTGLDLAGLAGTSFPQVMLRDLDAGTTSIESVSSAGELGDAESRAVELSADGRLLVFASGARNLVAGDTNLQPDIFLRDRTSGLTLRVNLLPGSQQFDGLSGWLSEALGISADGTRLAFESTVNPFLPEGEGDSDPQIAEVFLHDLASGHTSWVSQPPVPDGQMAASFNPCLGSVGDEIVFQSSASNLVPVDANGAFMDAFARDLALVTWAWAGHALPGGGGFALLHAEGSLLPGAPGELVISGGAPSAPMLLFVSLAPAPVAFKGGTLVAVPFLLAVPLFTDTAGAELLPFLWPAGVPSGTRFAVQAAIADAGAPGGVALTNALEGHAP